MKRFQSCAEWPAEVFTGPDGGHLNQAYHKPVEAWIPKQRTDLELARAKKAWARQEDGK